MKFKSTFLDDERIVRFIYSEKNINPRTNKLKANFVQFRPNQKTGKMELSCSRFELEDLDYCRMLGRNNQDPLNDRLYFGMGCIQVSQVRQLDSYNLTFTPLLEDTPKNYFHCDIYDELVTAYEVGVANQASLNFRKDQFRNIWQAFKDEEIRKKDTVRPLSNLTKTSSSGLGT